jgi:hypothetical protein
MSIRLSTPVAGLILLMIFGSLSGCSPRLMLINQAADAWATQSQEQEEDLGLAREASAFYLKASESLLRQTPAHLPLAQSVASGLTQYAYAFVAFEAERLHGADTKAARQLNERARRLYWRAHRHAMTALSRVNPDMVAILKQPRPDQKQKAKLSADQVGAAYWAAASWGAFIALSKDDPEAVADLPVAVRLAELAWHTSPQFGDGALASLMGQFEAARPGGRKAKAIQYFDQAIEMGAGAQAGPYVAKAEAIALADGDRPAFEALLRKALAASDKRTDLNNQIMRQRAQWLLDSADELF